MNKEKTAIENIASMNLEGLLLPEPAPASYWWLWIVVGLLTLIIAIAWFKRYRSPKAIALRQLNHLKKELSIDEISDARKSQKIKKEIARSLRQGFEATRLDTVMPDNMKWREYVSHLETSLYANKPIEPQALSSLIKTAQNWLRVSA